MSIPVTLTLLLTRYKQILFGTLIKFITNITKAYCVLNYQPFRAMAGYRLMGTLFIS